MPYHVARSESTTVWKYRFWYVIVTETTTVERAMASECHLQDGSIVAVNNCSVSDDKGNDRFCNNGNEVGTIDSTFNLIDGEP